MDQESGRSVYEPIMSTSTSVSSSVYPDPEPGVVRDSVYGVVSSKAGAEPVYRSLRSDGGRRVDSGAEPEREQGRDGAESGREPVSDGGRRLTLGQRISRLVQRMLA